MPLEIDRLLEPIAPTAPCGVDLRYEPRFDQLEADAEPRYDYERVNGGGDRRIVRPRQWARIREGALELAAEGRDLRLMLLLLRSLVGTDGAIGLRDGLRLIRHSLDRYWEDLHPRLDPDEEEPAQQGALRLACLEQLTDDSRLLDELVGAVLIDARGLGDAGLREIRHALGRKPLSNGEEGPDRALVEAIFKAAEPGRLEAVRQAIDEAGAELAAIESVLVQRFGGAAVPDFSGLSGLLREMAGDFGSLAPPREAQPQVANEQPGVTVAHPAHDGATDPAAATMRSAGPGRLETPADVVQTLDQVLEYYRCKEPSSPIPLLVQRAKKLVPMGFVELIADLAPAGLPELKELSGVEESALRGAGSAQGASNGEALPETTAATAAIHSPGQVRTRSEVVGALDQVLDYYRAKEPSSPVPLIVERTKRLVPMSFVELVADLAPAGLQQIRKIGGVGEKDNSHQ
jgi:type VI secretion system protein ImpA